MLEAEVNSSTSKELPLRGTEEDMGLGIAETKLRNT
jgi:hypothetical protein